MLPPKSQLGWPASPTQLNVDAVPLIFNVLASDAVVAFIADDAVAAFPPILKLTALPVKLLALNTGDAPELIFCGKLNIIFPVDEDAIIWLVVPVIVVTIDADDNDKLLHLGRPFISVNTSPLVPGDNKVVILGANWYGIDPATPPDIFVVDGTGAEISIEFIVPTNVLGLIAKIVLMPASACDRLANVTASVNPPPAEILPGIVKLPLLSKVGN